MKILKKQIFDTDCVLLLHMNGENGSTTFIDSSVSGNSPHTMTAALDAQISTAQYKFGNSSGLFDGSGDYIWCPTSEDFNFGSEDFTIDFCARFNSLSSRQDMFGCRGSGAYIRCTIWNATTMDIAFSNASEATIDGIASTSCSFVIDTWYHIAFVRSGINQYLFINGSSVVLSSNIYGVCPDTINPLKIGTVDEYNFFNGYMNEFRILKGRGEWTSNFVAPTEQYNLLSNNIVLSTNNKTTMRTIAI